jgi:hypothetical protein
MEVEEDLKVAAMITQLSSQMETVDQMLASHLAATIAPLRLLWETGWDAHFQAFASRVQGGDGDTAVHRYLYMRAWWWPVIQSVSQLTPVHPPRAMLLGTTRRR